MGKPPGGGVVGVEQLPATHEEDMHETDQKLA